MRDVQPLSASDPSGRRWALAFPFLVALLSVTTLAAENAESGIRPGDLAVPSLLAVLIAGCAWLGAGIVVRHRPSRAALAGWIAGAVLFGGRIADLTIGFMGSHWAELGLGVLLVVVPIVFWKSMAPTVPPRVLRFLGLCAVLVLGLQAWGMRPLLWEPAGDERASPSVEMGDTRDLPDIYFILLDAYSGPRSLQEVYGLDISPFLDSLEGLGFEVARASNANYPATFLALAAMLDWDYPEALFAELGGDSTDRTRVFQLLHDNRTTRFLQEQGYEIVHYRSRYVPLRSSPVADVHVPAFAVADFEIAWLEHTILFSAMRGVCQAAPCNRRGAGRFSPDIASAYEATFRALASAPRERERARFHYAHILSPHTPFVFQENCAHRAEPYMPPATDADEAELRRLYVIEVRCLNRLLIRAMERILSQEGSDPVIILQADHGYGRLLRNGRPQPLAVVAEPQLRERLDVFAAYYLPGGPAGLTYDGITPVNAMRAVFRDVFGLDLAAVPDHSFWSSADRPFDLHRIDLDTLSRRPGA